MRELLGEEVKEYFPTSYNNSGSALPADLKKNINSAPYIEEMFPANADGLGGDLRFIISGESSPLSCSTIVPTVFTVPFFYYRDRKITESQQGEDRKCYFVMY